MLPTVATVAAALATTTTVHVCASALTPPPAAIVGLIVYVYVPTSVGATDNFVRVETSLAALPSRPTTSVAPDTD